MDNPPETVRLEQRLHPSLILQIQSVEGKPGKLPQSGKPSILQRGIVVRIQVVQADNPGAFGQKRRSNCVADEPGCPGNQNRRTNGRLGRLQVLLNGSLGNLARRNQYSFDARHTLGNFRSVRREAVEAGLEPIHPRFEPIHPGLERIHASFERTNPSLQTAQAGFDAVQACSGSQLQRKNYGQLPRPPFRRW